MISVNEYDKAYAELIPAYQSALADGDDAARNQTAGAIMEQASGLLYSVLARGRESGGVGLKGEQLDDAVTDAQLAVLDMARDFDPAREVTFAQWLKSAAAPWRAAAKSTADAYRNGGERTQGEARVLSLMFGVLQEFHAEHGRKPSPVELRAAMDRKKEEGTTSDERNKRSGFDAAYRHLEELYASLERVWYPDRAGDDGADMWDALACHELDPVGQAALERDYSEDWAQLAGVRLEVIDEDGDKVGKKQKAAALARLASPHAQWAFLSAEVVHAT